MMMVVMVGLKTYEAAISVSFLPLLAPLLALQVSTRAYALIASTSVHTTGLDTRFSGMRVENIDK